MCEIYKYKENQPVVWFHRNPSKSNQYCLYCGAFVGEKSAIISNKEHLIGREFVPTGSLDGGTKFNFIFRACKKCNTEKSNIERHISTISLFTSPARQEEEHYNSVADRKASSDYHPDKKGVLVKDASDVHKIHFNHTSKLQISFDLVSPPQPNIYYLKALAYKHLQGLFTLLTTKNALDPKQTKLLSGQFFYFFGAVNKHDWGNPQIMSAIKKSKELECCANIDTADGFFKANIRKNNNKAEEWFWALEWNKSIRVFGGIYDPGKTPPVFTELPQIEWQAHNQPNNGSVRIRKEIPLPEDEDDLFHI